MQLRARVAALLALGHGCGGDELGENRNGSAKYYSSGGSALPPPDAFSLNRAKLENRSRSYERRPRAEAKFGFTRSREVTSQAARGDAFAQTGPSLDPAHDGCVERFHRIVVARPATLESDIIAVLSMHAGDVRDLVVVRAMVGRDAALDMFDYR